MNLRPTAAKGKFPYTHLTCAEWTEKDDWRPGDLAECLLERWKYDWPQNPKKGEVSVVREATATGLMFEDRPGSLSWSKHCFRRVGAA